jgi:hypothetical protein
MRACDIGRYHTFSLLLLRHNCLRCHHCVHHHHPCVSRAHSTLCVGQVRVKKDAGCRHHQAGDVQSPPMPPLAPSTSPRRQWHRCSLRVPGKRRAMAVTSFSRFLRAHNCAPPQRRCRTRGREEGVDGQPLPRSVSHLAMRAAVWFLSTCQGD